jgi:hypothetical protein
VAWVNFTVAGMDYWLRVKHAPGGNIGNYVQYRQSSHLQYHILGSIPLQPSGQFTQH